MGERDSTRERGKRAQSSSGRTAVRLGLPLIVAQSGFMCDSEIKPARGAGEGE